MKCGQRYGAVHGICARIRENAGSEYFEVLGHSTPGSVCAHPQRGPLRQHNEPRFLSVESIWLRLYYLIWQAVSQVDLGIHICIRSGELEKTEIPHMRSVAL